MSTASSSSSLSQPSRKRPRDVLPKEVAVETAKKKQQLVEQNVEHKEEEEEVKADDDHLAWIRFESKKPKDNQCAYLYGMTPTLVQTLPKLTYERLFGTCTSDKHFNDKCEWQVCQDDCVQCGHLPIEWYYNVALYPTGCSVDKCATLALVNVKFRHENFTFCMTHVKLGLLYGVCTYCLCPLNETGNCTNHPLECC
jgi:hypothetical protein